jgi:DUF438 domain-containing protein
LRDKKQIVEKLILKIYQNPKKEILIRHQLNKIFRELTPLDVLQIEKDLISMNLPKGVVELLCDVKLMKLLSIKKR